MKIYWDKIPKCFSYVVISDRDHNVVAFMEEPSLGELLPSKEVLWMRGDDYSEYPLLDGRYLIEHEEYELDGTEDWKESLQERPGTGLKPCPLCGSKNIKLVFHAGTWGYTEDEYRMECSDCGCRTKDELTEKAAKDKWNKRVEQELNHDG